MIRTTILLTILLAALPAAAGSALDFDGSNDHVTMGEAPELGLAVFTVECWFRCDGEGSAANTGVGGLDLWPLVGKGRGQSDGGTEDMNYLLGLRAADGVLGADFEDMADGGNHPVVGATPACDGVWHHAAVTYDGSAWALYLDGLLDGGGDTGGAEPRHDSEQHFGVATAFNTSGTADGRFRGAIDEVRVWSVARSGDAIRASINTPIDAAEAGLVARWGLDEDAGEIAADSIGTLDGDIEGATWTGDAPLDLHPPPTPAELLGPGDGDGDVPQPVGLRVRVDDPEGDALDVRFLGALLTDDPTDFSVVTLPDSQYYSCECGNGEPETFLAQTQWVVDHREEYGVEFVTHVGDIVDHGDTYEDEWINADAAMSLLEDPVTTGLAEGIPYGIAPGNHDQTPSGATGTTVLYNQYFGVHRFEGYSWYGDHLGDDNDNHYELFSSGDLDFVVLHLEYDPVGDPDILDWASDVLDQYADRTAILSSHYLLGTDGVFSTQGLITYEALKHHPNLLLMQAGHLTGESWRADTYDGHTVFTLLADYQFRDNGGDGWMRILQFQPRQDRIQVITWSPTLGEFEADLDSDFELPFRMSSVGLDLLGEVEAVKAGSEVELAWPDLDVGASYQWTVEVSDGQTTTTATWIFSAGEEIFGDDDDDDDDDDSAGPTNNSDDGGRDCGCRQHGQAAGQARSAMAALCAAVGLFLHRRRRDQG